MKKILILAALIPALPAQADRYTAKFGLSQLTIHGNSSVHKWKVETKLIGGFLNVDGAALGKTGPSGATGTVIVPVRQLKSGKKRMDEVMHAAMNEPKHKLIKFTISSLEVNSVKDGVSTCTGKGSIEINGIKKPLTFDVSIASKGNQLTVTGSTPIKMTDFGITPPSPKLPTGNITTDPEVKISFDWVVAKK